MKKNIIAKVLMVVLLMLGIASSVWANGVASKKAVLEGDNYVFFIQTTLIISKKPGNTGISRDIRTEFTTDLLLSD